MALEGQLSDFNLAEILQLISSQQKSGFLNLETTRNMVFIFDKGVLISTRDRRGRTRDPLESFLRAYGFFDDRAVEAHRVRARQQLPGPDRDPDLRGAAGRGGAGPRPEEPGPGDERRGHEAAAAAATTSAPPRTRPRACAGAIRQDVQGLLMEAARRLDEEELLREALPSQAMTFTQGAKVLPAEAIGETGKRIMKLALAGLTLGQIIRQGRTESFTVRDLLKNWCGDNVLVMHTPGDDEGTGQDEHSRRPGLHLATGLRSLPLTVLMLAMIGLGLGPLVRHAAGAGAPGPGPARGPAAGRGGRGRAPVPLREVRMAGEPERPGAQRHAGPGHGPDGRGPGLDLPPGPAADRFTLGG